MSKCDVHNQPPCQSPAEEEEEEEEDGDPKICQVCGDQATGYHFNAMTCEGCKGFFRRTIKRTTPLRCPLLNKCVITKSNRRQCQACRLRKCQAIGMLKELIMSDEAVEKRRSRIKLKRMDRHPVLLTPQQEAALQELVTAHHKTFDMTFSRFNEFRPINRNLNPMFPYNQSASQTLSRHTAYHRTGEQSDCMGSSSSLTSSSSLASPLSPLSLPPLTLSPLTSSEREEKESGVEPQKTTVFSTLPHVADLTTYMIQNIITFAKGLPSFRALAIEDQISLLKGATFEMVQIRFNMLFNSSTGMWECGPITYCMDDAVRAGFQRHLLDPLMRLHYTLRNLRLQEEEYVLMKAISLFSPDRVGVQNRDVVDALQEMLALTLKTHIDCKRKGPDKHLLYPKVMACLTEMRSMNEEYTKQVLQIQNIQPDVSPLILEVVSKDP